MSVYFVQATAADGVIKIGRSNTPLRRIAGMQVGSPVALTLMAVEPGDAEHERHLHMRFAHCRASGEWFNPAPDLLKYIEAIPAWGDRQRRGMRLTRPMDLVIDQIAREIGIPAETRKKWRQRGVPYRWRENIGEIAGARGVAISRHAFARFGRPDA